MLFVFKQRSGGKRINQRAGQQEESKAGEKAEFLNAG